MVCTTVMLVLLVADAEILEVRTSTSIALVQLAFCPPALLGLPAWSGLACLVWPACLAWPYQPCFYPPAIHGLPAWSGMPAFLCPH